MVIYQFWDFEPPDYIQALMGTWKDSTIGRHLRFDDASARAFIKDHASDRAVAAYDACAVPAMKADLFRYVAIYTTGGLWADADVRRRIDLGADLLDHQGLLFFRNNNVANDIMYFSSKAHPLLEYTLDQAINNIEKRNLKNVWSATGPGIMTRLYREKTPQTASLFDGIKIIPYEEMNHYVEFVGGLQYKKSGHHWTEIQKRRSIYKTNM